MSLRVVLVFAIACSSSTMQTKKGEPQTAREKLLAEQKTHPDEEDASGTGKKWSRWRYQGERKDCFFQFNGHCFKTENAACQAAKCKTKCASEGAGPVTVKCTAKSAE